MRPTKLPSHSVASALLFASTLLLSCLLRAEEPRSTNASQDRVPLSLRLATGESGGAYRILGACLDEELKKRNGGVRLQVLPSAGSVDNIDKIARNEADLALVQSDVAHRAARGQSPFPNSVHHLSVVANLFPEKVYVWVRPNLYVFTVSELRGKSVFFDSEGSGTAVTAQQVLEASGLLAGDFQVSKAIGKTNWDTVAQRLCRGELDAAIRVAASVEFPSECESHRLLAIENTTIDRLRLEGEYVKTSVSETPLQWRPGIPSVSVKALLVARPDPGLDSSVGSVLAVLHEQRGNIETCARDHGVPISLSLMRTDIVPDPLLPLHATAVIYQRTEYHRRLHRTILWLTIAIAFLASGWLVLRNRPRSIKRPLQINRRVRNRIIMAALFLIVFFVIPTFLLYVFESSVNENFASIEESAWSLLVYTVGGFDRRAPITWAGEVLAVIWLVFAAALVAWAIAKVADYYFGENVSKLIGRKKVSRVIKDHIVILNWDNGRSERLIQELHGPDFEQRLKKPIVIVSPVEVHVPSHGDRQDVVTIRGNPTSVRDLKMAGVERAHSVTIISAWQSENAEKTLDHDSADLKTIRTISAVRSCCEESGEELVPIVAEIKAERNVETAKMAGKNGVTEIVCVERYGSEILTQCALTPGLADLYISLLTFSAESSEIYKTCLPGRFVGMTFLDLVQKYAEWSRRAQRAVLPIAIYRKSKVYVNPNKQPECVLQTRDELFVIAPNQTDADSWSDAVATG
jgi:TRAP transporter TAXI family solute receptor